ncbi:FMN binding oxidoreductase [Aspergillus californicus]
MMDSTLAQPLTLQCGLRLKNRLVKAAMAEDMADADGLPTQLHDGIYAKWGEGGWGMVLTGNVQVDMKYLGQARDTSVNLVKKTQLVEKWKSWATASKTGKTPVVMQINHPGRQSPLGAGSRGFCEKNIAPSAIPLDFGSGLLARTASSLVFGTPREMTQGDIDTVVQQFVDCSVLASETGFDGVEIHAAHGYLLAQFLSAKTNHRTDGYGGSNVARAKIVVDIIRAIRAAVPKGFCVGIKLNSVDHQSKNELDGCIEQLRSIVDAGVDFVEISGGSYEDPQMMQTATQSPKEKSSRTVVREAFFLEFAAAIRSEFPSTHLMVTGGFRTRQGMVSAVEQGACEMVGLGRPAVLEPALPKKIVFNPEVPDDEAVLAVETISTPWIVKATGLKGVGAGVESQWYSKKIQEEGRN